MNFEEIPLNSIAALGQVIQHYFDENDIPYIPRAIITENEFGRCVNIELHSTTDGHLIDIISRSMTYREYASKRPFQILHESINEILDEIKHKYSTKRIVPTPDVEVEC